MKVPLIILSVLILLMGSYVLLRTDSVITNYPPKIGPIVAFGDSLVEGVGATPSENFVSRLSVKIAEPIINMGVSGDTTDKGLARIQDVLDKEPRIVLLLLGGNDYLRRISKEQTFTNLESIITQLQSRGAIVVLLGVRGGILSDGYDTEYEKLAKKTGSLYVEDVLQGVITKPDLMHDGIHPNAKGYAIIADRVYETLASILK